MPRHFPIAVYRTYESNHSSPPGRAPAYLFHVTFRFKGWVRCRSDDKQLPEGITHSELEPRAVDSANFHFRKPTPALPNSDKNVESRTH